MAGLKSILALLGLAAIVHSARVPIDQEYVSTFLQGVRELEEQSKHLEDLLTSGSAIEEKKKEFSREELEEDTGKIDGSASQESTKEETTKKPETEIEKRKPESDAVDDVDGDDDDDDDDDDDVPLDLVPVRGFGTLFGNLPSIFGISQPKAWWSGPNVCVERDSKEEKSELEGLGGDFLAFGTAHFSSCQNTPTKYSCKTITREGGKTKTSIVSYQCCHGFRRTANSPECTKVETKPIYEIASDLGSDKFSDMIKAAGLEPDMEGNITIFLPSNLALSDHHASIDSMNQLDPVQTNEVPISSQSAPGNEKSFVLSHVVDGVYEISDMNDEMVLKTKDDSTLRINFLPNRGVAVNCVRMNTTDRLTENGVVHLVEKVLEPVKESLAEKLAQPRFSKFKQMLEDSNLWDLMSGEKGLTVFAVENEAAEKLGDKHKMCMKNVLSHHILPHTLCSATADSGQQLATLDLAKNWLPFTQKDGQMIIGNSTKILKADDVATNGIVHVAEAFIVPSSARLLSELLDQTNHSEWLSVIKKAGLLEDLESTENITMFVPTDKAVRARADLADMSPDQLQEVVRFHVGKDQSGHTVSTMLKGKNLTVSAEKSMFPGLLGLGRFMSVECSQLTKVGGRVCNGLLHEVDAVLTPPTQDVVEFIGTNEKLTTLKKILEGTKLEDELKSGLDYPVTFLAPSNEAFEDIGNENVESLLNDKELADQILRAHVLKEPVCCTNVVPSTWPFVPSAQTLSTRPIEINKRGDTAVFGSMPTSDCDNIVNGGVVHIVRGVRLARSRPRDRELILRRPNSEIILAGI